MNKEFLYKLLDSMSVSGHEIPLQKEVIREMTPCCDTIRKDHTGNVICIHNPEAEFKVLLAGHIDEIGLIVTHIQPDGLLRVGKAGGIYPTVYPGHQVVIHSAGGPVYGVVNNHRGLTKEDLKVESLYIDIGAKDAEDAGQCVQPGDPVHLHSYHQQMRNGFLSARGIDDRGGAFIVLEALKLARQRGCPIGIYAATTVGEETTGRGANWVGSRIQPDVAVIVDVTYATDVPGTHPEESGKICLGKGPVICNSSLANRKVNQLLKRCAEETGIPYQVESFIGRTYTDADAIHTTGTGVVTALLSLPLRYMHNPAEMCAISDIENAISLLAEFLCRINADTDLDPFN